MTQLPQHLDFDSADASTGNGEALDHFFQRVLAAVFEAKAHLTRSLIKGLRPLRNRLFPRSGQSSFPTSRSFSVEQSF